MFQVTGRITGFDDAFDDLLSAIQAETLDTVREQAELVARQATVHHRYTTRTGMLEARTGAELAAYVVGDKYLCRVYGATDYGSYVETLYDGRYAFLEPALQATEAERIAMTDGIGRRAVARLRGEWRAD